MTTRDCFSSTSVLFSLPGLSFSIFLFPGKEKKSRFRGEAGQSLPFGVGWGAWGGDPFLPGKEREGGVVPAASLHPIHALCDFLQRYPTAPPRFSELGVFIDY